MLVDNKLSSPLEEPSGGSKDGDKSVVIGKKVFIPFTGESYTSIL